MRFGLKSSDFLLVGGAALASVAIATGGLAYYRKHRVPCFPYIGRELTTPSYDALAARPGWRAGTLAVGGARLRGLVRTPRDAGAPWILFFGGNSSHLLEDGVRFLDRATEGHDWGGAVWAYRGYDGSSGTPDPVALSDDARRAYARLADDERVATSRIHLVGFSLGTSIVAGLAARGEPPATVTLLAPATELDMHPPGGACRDRFETLKYLDGMRSPTLVVHGARDRTLPVSGGRSIAARLGPRARFIEHGDLGHLDLPDSPAVIEEVRAFIEEHARSERASPVLGVASSTPDRGSSK